MQNKLKKLRIDYKKIICIAIAVLMVIALIIAIIPSPYAKYSVDADIGAMPYTEIMNTVSGIQEVTVFQDEPASVSTIKNNSDSPAYLATGLESVDDLADSATRSYLMSSGVTLSSSKVDVTSSALDRAIQLLSFDEKSLQTFDGGTGRKISGDTTALETLISKAGMEVGFLAVRISDGAAIAYQPDMYFQSCSTIKAPLCLYVAKLISEGKLDDRKSVAYTSNNYIAGSGIIKNSSFGTHYKIKTLVEYSISKSDNIAHKMLANTLGTSGFFDMLDRMNCNIPLTQNTVWSESNARSAVLWWSQIYSFKDNGQTGKWLWDLFDISYSKLSPALGKDCHTKPGSSTYCSHESGVVLGNEPYIVAIYTKTNSASGVSDSYFYSLAKEIDRLITG